MPQLYALHEVDARIHHLEQNRQKLDNGDRAKQALIAAIQELRRREDDLKHTRARLGTSETELAFLETKAKDLSKRLYGGSIKSAKDAEAAETEIAYLKARASEKETEILELMDVIGTRAEGVAAQRVQAQALDATMKETLATYQRQSSAIERELAAAQAQRAQALKPLSSQVVNQYEAIRRRNRDTAVALLDGNNCTGCHMQVPGISIIRLTSSQDLVPCDNCGRLLFRQA